MNSVATFPAYDPTPNMVSLWTAIEAVTSLSNSVAIYKGDTSGLSRVENYFSITIAGTLNNAVKGSLEKAIKDVWIDNGQLYEDIIIYLIIV